MATHRVMIVVNSSARGGAETLAEEVVERCRGLDRETVLLAPQGRDRAVIEVADAVAVTGPWSAVVAIGGDGTVRTVAEGLARGIGRLPDSPDGAATGGPPLLVVPGGTGNSVYRALWEDRPWPEVLDDAFAGRTRVRDLDLLRIAETGSYAFLGASTGLIAEAVRLSATLTGVSGRERYQAAALAALEQHAAFPARVTVDGAVLHDGSTTLVAVGGARHRSGTFQLLPRSVLDDGLLDVCVIRGVGADAFIDLAGVIVAGEHVGRPEVAYAQGRSMTLERTDGAPLLFEHDGDLWVRDDRSLTLDIVRGAVPAYAPMEPVAG